MRKGTPNHKDHPHKVFAEKKGKKVLFAIFYILFLFPLFLPAQASFPLYSCYDVTSYELEVKLNAEKQRIAGSCRMYFTANRNIDRIQMDLASSLQIARIRLGRRNLRYDRSGSMLTVEFPYTLAQGAKEAIEIVYGGTPDTRQLDRIFSTDKGGQVNIRLIPSLLSPQGWWPTKMRVPDEVDSMRLNVIFEKGRQVICNGTFRYQVSEPGEFQRSVFSIPGPLIPEEVELHIGSFQKLTEIYRNDAGYHELNYYVSVGNRSYGQSRLDQIQRSLSCLEAYFGQYPFTPSGLMWVDPGGASINQEWEIYGVDSELIQELSRQWWGKKIHTNLAEDAWITQAFQIYATSLVIECQQDSRQSLSYLQSLPEDQKHALILHSVRNLTDNEEAWFEACRSLSETFMDRPITSEALADYFQWKLNLDVSNIFQQYLLYPSPPVLEYSVLSKGKKLTLTYRWRTNFDDFDMPVDIYLKGNRERILPTTEWQSQTWKGVSARHLNIDRNFGWFEVQELEL